MTMGGEIAHHFNNFNTDDNGKRDDLNKITLMTMGGEIAHNFYIFCVLLIVKTGRFAFRVF